MKLPYFKNPRKYTRGKIKEVIKYKGVNNLYDTKKELIKGENLTRWQVDNNLDKYVFEIKELFSEVYRHKVPTGKVFPDYEHIIPLNIEDCNALVEEFKTDIEKGNKLKLAQHEVFALLRYVRRFERDDFLSIIKYKRKSGGRLFNIYSEDNFPVGTLCLYTSENNSFISKTYLSRLLSTCHLVRFSPFISSFFVSYKLFTPLYLITSFILPLVYFLGFLK
jgi:hypothetical protein